MLQHTKIKKSIARRFSGTRDASLRDQQLKRQAFFGSFFQRLEKMNNTKQNKIQPINRNLLFIVAIYSIHTQNIKA